MATGGLTSKAVTPLAFLAEAAGREAILSDLGIVTTLHLDAIPSAAVQQTGVF